MLTVSATFPPPPFLVLTVQVTMSFVYFGANCSSHHVIRSWVLTVLATLFCVVLTVQATVFCVVLTVQATVCCITSFDF